MSEAAFQIPGTNMIALEAMAEGAGVDVATFIGESIGLGLNLADISIDAGCQGAVLLEQPDGGYNQYPIDFSVAVKPELPAEMAGFESDMEYLPPYQLVLPPLVVGAVEETAGILATSRADFIEAAISFRHLWSLTRRHNGEILIDDKLDGHADYIVVEDDSLFFKYDL